MSARRSSSSSAWPGHLPWQRWHGTDPGRRSAPVPLRGKRSAAHCCSALRSPSGRPDQDRRRSPTLDNMLVLGLIVLIRTFLFSLEVEIDGALPWRRALTSGPSVVKQASKAAALVGSVLVAAAAGYPVAAAATMLLLLALIGPGLSVLIPHRRAKAGLG